MRISAISGDGLEAASAEAIERNVSADGSCVTKRLFVFGGLAAFSAALGGCSATPAPRVVPEPARRPIAAPTEMEMAARYAAVTDGGYDLPAVPYEQIDPRYYRQRVENSTGEPPDTIVVVVPERFLYVVEPGGTAMRYGVGLGRAGFEWSGEGIIQWRTKWPKWTPPAEMIKRQPQLEQYSAENGGQVPGPDNPLGARALYIFQDGEDTLYRLHGTKEWNSIGQAVSSGCVRLINQDVIDLHDRVPRKARIVVRQ